MPTHCIRVFGRVQGVGFRQWAQTRAQALHLRGTAQNCSDGSVEVVAVGEHDALRAFESECYTGPSGAHVSSVVVTEEAVDRPLEGFLIH